MTEEELSAAVARVIRELVTERGWSGREFARRMEVSPSVAAYKLSGERPFDIADLAVVAAALETTVTALIGRAEGSA